MMRELLRLTRANLLTKPLVNSMNIIVLAIGTAMLSILLQFSSHMDQKIARDLAGIDLVVGAKGSPLQLILSSLLHMDTPTGNVPFHEVERLEHNRLVRSVTPLALGDNFRGFRLVGTMPDFTELYGATLAEGRKWQTPQEVVIGARVHALLGMNVGQRFFSAHGLEQSGGRNVHESHPYEVVGVLEETGTVIDRLILTSLHSIWHAHGQSEEPEAGHDAHDDHEAEHDLEVTAILVRFASPRAALILPRQINAQPGLQAAVPAIEVTRVLELSAGVAAAAKVIGAALAITAMFGVFASMTNAMSHRIYDIALVRVMGASRQWVMAQCLLEGIILATLGAVAGIILGHAGLAFAATMSDKLVGSGLNGSVLAPDELWLIPMIALLGALAALLPAVRAYRQDISRLLQQGNNT